MNFVNSPSENWRIDEILKFGKVSKTKKQILLEDYTEFLQEIKDLIQKKQLQAFRKVNQLLIELHWYIGQKIVEKQEKFRWGKSVVEKLSMDLQKDFPGMRGFSVQNLWYMRNFYLAYYQEPKFRSLLGEVGWTHHIVLLEKLKDTLAREYYMLAIRRYGWTANILIHKIESGDFERFIVCKSHNFDQTLPEKFKNQAKLAVKDHYVFDFLEMANEYLERELEDALVQNLPDLIMELGYGEFAFLGRQFKITVGGEEVFIDLLFYHRGLKSLVAIELKIGKFEPEYVGKMNFYLKALDMHVRKKDENPSIGIILCKAKNQTFVEYSFSDIEKPMGVATYSTSKALPKEYKGLIPSAEEIENKIEEYKKRHFLSENNEDGKSLFEDVFEKVIHSNSYNLNMRQTKFLQSAKLNSDITSSEYAKITGVSLSTALRDLKDLHKNGYLEKSGKRKNTFYKIVKI